MNNRSGDPRGEDYTRQRNGFTWQLPFNLGGVTGRGPVALVALFMIGVFMTAGALVYINYKGFESLKIILNETQKANATQHEILTNTQDRFSCAITFTQEDRAKLRESRNWNQWCWWIK